MADTANFVLEFTRMDQADRPHAFTFAPQKYTLRTPGGGTGQAEFPWTEELLADLQELGSQRQPDVVRRIGQRLADFLDAAGWDRCEAGIVAAAQSRRPIFVTIRSFAAELYMLPWELAVVRPAGQPLGGVQGVVVRYEWPDTVTTPDTIPAALRRRRVLLAWSAAGGGVPAAGLVAALRDALGDDFRPDRDVLPHVTPETLAAALVHAETVGPPIDVLHLLCHGVRMGDSFGLRLGDVEGDIVDVDAGRMQLLLQPHAGMVRLVALLACDSGNPGTVDNQLGSVAQLLHRVGFRAVLSSRFVLSTKGAVGFARSFYSALARPNAALSRAFVAARQSLARTVNELDWESLQLHAREDDGDEGLPAIAAVAPAAVPPPSVQPSRRGVAAVLLTIGLVAAGVGAFAIFAEGEAAPPVQPVSPQPEPPEPQPPEPQPPEPEPPEPKPSPCEIALRHQILYESNQWRLDPPDEKLLIRVVDLLRRRPEVAVEIVGHTDDREGTGVPRDELARRRAGGVRELLVARGVDGSRVVAVGRGDADPQAENATTAGRQRNRRVEFRPTNCANVGPVELPTESPIKDEKKPARPWQEPELVSCARKYLSSGEDSTLRVTVKITPGSGPADVVIAEPAIALPGLRDCIIRQIRAIVPHDAPGETVTKSYRVGKSHG